MEIEGAVFAANILTQIPATAIDFDGRILFWSKGAELLYGLTAEDVIGQPVRSCYAWEYLNDGDDQTVLSAIKQNGAWSGDLVHILGDGRRLFVETEVRLLHDDAGTEIGLSIVTRDASARLKREKDRSAEANRTEDEARQQWEQLRSSGDVLESFLENLPACICVKDEGGRNLFYNRAAREAVPASADFRGKTGKEIFGPELGERIHAIDLEVLASNEPVRTIEFLESDGIRRSFLVIKFPIQDARGSRFVGGISMDITESVRDQEELRKQAALLDLSSDAIFVTTLDGEITYWNQGAESLYGWTAEEAMGKDDRELLKAKLPLPYQQLVRVLLRDGHWEGEVTRSHRDGAIIEVLTKWSLLRDASGAPTARLVTNTDLTDIKFALQEVRLAQAKAEARAAELTAILDTMPAAVLIAHDRECTKMTGSRFVQELLQLPDGANPSKSAVPEERPAFRILQNGREIPSEELPIQQAAATGRPVSNCEFTVALEDGTTRDFFGHAAPLLNERGEVRGAVGAFIDVTERDLAEAEARRNEAILRSVMDATSDYVFLKDRNGRYLMMNRAASSVVGTTPEEALGKDDFDLFPREIAEYLQEEDREAIASDGSLTFELETPIANGLRHLHTVKSACRDANGEIIGVVGIGRDITERKALEDSLRTRERELSEAHRIARLGTWNWICGPDKSTLSEEVFRIFGRDPNSGGPAFAEMCAMCTPESARRLEGAVSQALSDGTSYEVDLEISMPDGSLRWIVGRGEVETWLDGKVASLRGTIQEITERKKNEQALTMSENRYRSLVRASAQIVWSTNCEGAATSGSPDWQAFTGLTGEADLGFGWLEAIHPDDRQPTIESWLHAVATGELYNFENRLRRHDGVYRHMAVRAVPVRDDAGRIVEWVGTHTDITDRKTAEQALLESEARFRKLFESDLLGICIPDRFGAFFEGNDEFLRIVGYTREDLEAGLVRWDVMTPPEYAELDALHIAEAAERGSCIPYEKEYIRKDGSRVPIACGYALLEDSQDVYIAFIQDLTQQKQAEAGLREREERFRVLAESLPEFVWIRDGDGRYIYCNQRLLDYVGKPPEWLQTHAFEAVHPDDVGATIENWKHSLETGEPYTNAYRLRRHDGVYRYFLARAVPMHNETGRVERWLGSTTDIHDQKIAEEGLRRAEKLNAVARLAASMSHEINNPLNSVVNSIYLALRDPTLKEDTRSHLTVAEQELARAAQVASQMLQYQNQSSAPALVDLSEIMDFVLNLFKSRLSSRSIVVEREYHTHEKLRCFSEEVRQVFANLISNSVDASNSRGKLRVRIAEGRSWSDPSEPGIRVTVADSGDGMPQAFQMRVFEPFVSTKDRTGTGLGLWVAEGIVKKHKGRITFRSSTDPRRHGTVFSVFLPRQTMNK